MLPKLHRLKSDRDFKKVFRGGKAAESRLLKIKFLENKEKSRFGFVVGAKLSKKAAERNLIKRRLRAAVSFLLRRIRPGFDIIIWPKPAALKSDYNALLGDLRALFSKNDILSL